MKSSASGLCVACGKPTQNRELVKTRPYHYRQVQVCLSAACREQAVKKATTR